MHSHDNSSFLSVRFLSVLLLGLAGPALSVRGAAEAAPAASATGSTPEQQAALAALDKVMGHFETLAGRDPDAQHKAATQVLLAGFEERSAALHTAFDQGRYDELRVDLNLEYQRLASWMAAPGTPPPAPQADPAHKADVYQLNPAPSNKAEVAAALETADGEIRRLDGRVEALPPGPARDAARLQIKASEDRHDGLARSFTTAGWKAFVADLKAQSEKLPP